jgi:hypothetical protein
VADDLVNDENAKSVGGGGGTQVAANLVNDENAKSLAWGGGEGGESSMTSLLKG